MQNSRKLLTQDKNSEDISDTQDGLVRLTGRGVSEQEELTLNMSIAPKKLHPLISKNSSKGILISDQRDVNHRVIKRINWSEDKQSLVKGKSHFDFAQSSQPTSPGEKLGTLKHSADKFMIELQSPKLTLKKQRSGRHSNTDIMKLMESSPVPTLSQMHEKPKKTLQSKPSKNEGIQVRIKKGLNPLTQVHQSINSVETQVHRLSDSIHTSQPQSGKIRKTDESTDFDEFY